MRPPQTITHLAMVPHRSLKALILTYDGAPPISGPEEALCGQLAIKHTLIVEGTFRAPPAAP